MSVTVTLYLWWLWAYLGMGLLLWLPLEVEAWCMTSRPKPSFWRSLWLAMRKPRTYTNLVVYLLVWPVALWQPVKYWGKKAVKKVRGEL